ncbi:MAG TPA: cell division protein FtsA, partial [Verrucomicrobiae bacterium]
MFDRSSTIVGLDIGTSKVCAVVGEINEAGALSVVGLGQAKSRGVRKGEIVDFNLAQEDIRNAIVEAEQMADVEIRSVYLGVTGPHIRGFNNRGFHPVASHDREIAQEDVEDAIKNAKTINLPAENRIIHVVRQHFLVDGQEGVLNPVGMFGARVEVDVHVVHGLYNRLQNPIKAVKALQLEVEDIIFNGIATALAVLNTQQKELGALIIDVGSGVTEYAVYARGVIKHTGVLAVGGDHVSNDLAYGLKVPLGRAEQLKIDHGCATVDDRARGQSIALSNDLGIHERNVSVDHIRRIMSARLEEIFEIIAQELEEAGVLNQVREGVFL